MILRIGSWIVVGLDGIWFSPFDKTYSFKTKKDALADVRLGVLDTKENPKTKRCGNGEYIYTPKSAESGFFKIVRITKYNAEHYRRWIEEQESRKENICLW